MISWGVRGGNLDLLIVHDYNENDAPVIIVTADANGGKSREHLNAHRIFDPKEDAFCDHQQWTYTDARQAALDSVAQFGLNNITVGQHLDKYFITKLKMNMHTYLRAGERSVFPGYAPKRSARDKTHRYQPY